MERIKPILFISIIIFVTAVAFLPSLFNGFVDWDDPFYVTGNDAIRDFSVKNTTRIFTSGFVGTYCPLAMLSYSVEYRLGGLNPFVYHLTNYLMHLFVTFLVFIFIYFLSQKADIAFISAILFGVHPLHVEPVAWIAERKELLCVIFYLLALIAYSIYLKRKRIKYYFFSLLCVILALLSKPMAVTLPVVFVLLDYFYGRKMDKRSVLEKVPVFALAAIFGFINLYFQTLLGATKLSEGFYFRIYFVSKAVLFYLSKTLVPVNLSAMYPYYSMSIECPGEGKYYIAALVLLAILVVFSRKFSRKIIFGSSFFIITILPVLKIVPAGEVFAADRYMYLPSIGIIYMLAVLFDRMFCSRTAGIKGMRSVMVLSFSLIVILFSVLTWKRCVIWKDTNTLFGDVIKKYPDVATPYNQMGLFYAKKGDMDRAIKNFKRALTIKPGSKVTRDNLERAQRQRRDILDQGMSSTTGQPYAGRDVSGRVELLNRSGEEQGKAGDLDKAISLFEEAIELDPDHAGSYNNLGYAYYKKGDYKQAEKYFKKTLEVDPKHEKAGINLDYLYKSGYVVKEGEEIR